MKTIEYRVRPVTRYVVTKFASEQGMCKGRDGVDIPAWSGCSEVCGEFDNQEMAERVAKSLAQAEPLDADVSYGGYPLVRDNAPETASQV